jgi:hypothetical protein
MADCTFVDHVIDLRLFAASRNPTGLSHTDAPPTDRDSDIVRSVLRQLAVLEVASTGSIVRQIVRAVEAHKPRARYVAPWWQGVGVRLLRAFGK